MCTKCPQSWFVHGKERPVTHGLGWSTGEAFVISCVSQHCDNSRNIGPFLAVIWRKCYELLCGVRVWGRQSLGRGCERTCTLFSRFSSGVMLENTTEVRSKQGEFRFVGKVSRSKSQVHFSKLYFIFHLESTGFLRMGLAFGSSAEKLNWA